MVVAPSIASAQSADLTASAAPTDDNPAPLQAIGYGAMPGGVHVPSAETLPNGAVEVSLTSGFGWRTGLLGPDHRMARGIGDLAVAYAATPTLTIGLAFDGRFDKHYGPPKQDDGLVGDPHLLVRLAKPFGNVKLGAQLGVWVPGKDAPSVAASAISVDVRALASLKAGPGSLSFDVGFRLDNSAKAFDHPDTDPESLTLQDRVSLGISDYNAVLGGAHLMFPSGRMFFGVEGSVDLFVGSGAPGAILRGGITGGYHLSPEWAVLAFVEGAKVPGVLMAEVANDSIALIPYEPMITGGLAIQARFGGPKRDTHIRENDIKADVAVIEYAEVSGEIVDETGKPVVGAKVTVRLKNNSGVGATDDKGRYAVDKLPIGKTVAGKTDLDDTAAEVSIVVDGKKPLSSTLTLVKGANSVATLTLEPELPPGELRAVVRSLATGKPLPGATVTIDPGGTKVTSDAKGEFTVALAPGTYKIKVSASGLADQVLDVTIDPNGVAIKNIELHK
jgi:hypothetical protein